MNNYRDLYKCILKNKGEFEVLSEAYYEDVIHKCWVEGGRKKLRDQVPTKDGWGNAEYSAINYIDSGDKLKNKAFSWFVCADLIKATKYFSLDDMRRWDTPDWKILKWEREFNNSHQIDFDEDKWRIVEDSIGLMELAELSLKQRSSYYRERMNIGLSKITDELKISNIRELLPKGFNAYIEKNTTTTSKGPRKIENKMQLIMWKKSIDTKKMTEKHFRDITNTYFGKWKIDAYNELSKNKTLRNTKYFKKAVNKEWFEDATGINLIMAKIKLEQLSGRFDRKSKARVHKYIIDILENVNVSDSEWGVDKFVGWVKETGVLKNIAFKEKRNAYFTKERFIEYIREIHK